MSQVRSLLFAVTIGAAGSVSGLAACQQDLQVDRAFYECESDSECGSGYTCGDHPQHGQVCLAPSQVTPDGGEPDGTGDVGPDAVEQGPALVVEVSSSVDQSPSDIQVFLVESHTGGCNQLMSRRAANVWPSKMVEAAQADVQEVRFYGVEETVKVLATGLNGDGVRTAVGCAADVAPPNEESPSVVSIELREQMPVFAPADYRMTMSWQFPVDVEPFGTYLRALMRLPLEPGTALVGCAGGNSRMCEATEDEGGLLQLIATARAVSEGPYTDLAERRLDLLSNPTVAAYLQEYFNESDQRYEIDGGIIDELVKGLAEKVVMEASLELRHGGPDWADTGVTTENPSGSVDVERMAVNLCHDRQQCPVAVANGFGAPVTIQFEGGRVTESSLVLDDTSELSISGFDYFTFLTQAFERAIYPQAVQSGGYSMETGIASFTETRWDCTAMVIDSPLDPSEPEGQDLEGLCNDIVSVAYFSQMLDELQDYHRNLFTLELEPAGPPCALSQPNYAQSDVWKNSDIAPMPVFTGVGQGDGCVWSVGLFETVSSTQVAEMMDMTFSASAKWTN